MIFLNAFNLSYKYIFFLLFKKILITFAFQLTESQGFILVKGMAQMSLLGC